jgi:hypothetical protein
VHGGALETKLFGSISLKSVRGPEALAPGLSPRRPSCFSEQPVTGILGLANFIQHFTVYVSTTSGLKFACRASTITSNVLLWRLANFALDKDGEKLHEPQASA